MNFLFSKLKNFINKVLILDASLLLFILFLFFYFDLTKKHTITVDINHNLKIFIDERLDKYSKINPKTTEEENILFKDMQNNSNFKIENCIEIINKKTDPNVIIWFTNYFGTVTKKNLDFNKENIFKKSKNSKFWLTDLKAWTLLSVDKDQLEENKLEESLKDNDYIPFFEKSKVLSEENIKNKNEYKILSSAEYFKWLSEIKEENIKLTNNELSDLCKEKPNEKKLKKSMLEMNFKSEFLSNKKLDRFGKNEEISESLSNVPANQIFPILQLIEGAYYISEVVNNNKDLESENDEIIFLIPNKEFLYYTDKNNNDNKISFDIFKEIVKNVLDERNIELNKDLNITFMPFVYGEGFRDAPYKASGSRLKKLDL